MSDSEIVDKFLLSVDNNQLKALSEQVDNLESVYDYAQENGHNFNLELSNDHFMFNIPFSNTIKHNLVEYGSNTLSDIGFLHNIFNK